MSRGDLDAAERDTGVDGGLQQSHTSQPTNVRSPELRASSLRRSVTRCGGVVRTAPGMSHNSSTRGEPAPGIFSILRSDAIAASKNRIPSALPPSDLQRSVRSTISVSACGLSRCCRTLRTERGHRCSSAIAQAESKTRRVLAHHTRLQSLTTVVELGCRPNRASERRSVTLTWGRSARLDERAV